MAINYTLDGTPHMFEIDVSPKKEVKSKIAAFEKKGKKVSNMMRIVKSPSAAPSITPVISVAAPRAGGGGRSTPAVSSSGPVGGGGKPAASSGGTSGGNASSSSSSSDGDSSSDGNKEEK